MKMDWHSLNGRLTHVLCQDGEEIGCVEVRYQRRESYAVMGDFRGRQVYYQLHVTKGGGVDAAKKAVERALMSANDKED